MKIAVIGSGYVGLSNALLLARHNTVSIVDIVKEKVELINSGRSPIADPDIERCLSEGNHSLSATTDFTLAIAGAEFVIIATPTNYDVKNNTFDTRSVVEVAERVLLEQPDATIIIRSTVPVGFTAELKQRISSNNLVFVPEFLREGRALRDNLYPSRVVVGGETERARTFAALLLQGAEKPDVEVLFMGATEAEATKLFSNTYLAMRVAFFNELDTFALRHALDPLDIINGVCHDPRIGDYYNNPSFGYGGYCLPKDTKQLLANYKKVPHEPDSCDRQGQRHAERLHCRMHSGTQSESGRNLQAGDESRI